MVCTPAALPVAPLTETVLTWFRGALPDSAPASPEECRARRAFVSEMLERSPEAFAGGQDVATAMALFPDRF